MKSRQSRWELWFTLSCIFFITMFVIGTLNNSKTFCPNWLLITSISSINLLSSIIVGCNTKYHQDK